MEVRQVAIACQGGGIHGAFTAGVLDHLLRAREEEQTRGDRAAKRRFEISALTGTSAGALNAFMVWYGLLSADGMPGRFAEARKAVNRLWDTFQVQRRGEWMINALGQQAYRLRDMGIDVRPKYPPYFSDWLDTALRQWTRVEDVIAPVVDAGEVRPEFYDFEALLRTSAPGFEDFDIERIARERRGPRLLIGAIEVLSGEFETFDSFRDPLEDVDPAEREDLAFRTEAEARRRISFAAIAASGTLPEIRRAQRIPGLKNRYGKEVLYWDGLYSHNPPVGGLVAGVAPEDVPDEIWVIRINPQVRAKEPINLNQIDDRQNELSGNLSLNQELGFIRSVNAWVREDRGGDGIGRRHKEIRLFMITMSREQSERLDLASKFDRDPAFVGSLRKHGEERAASFLDFWTTAEDEALVSAEWPREVCEVVRGASGAATGS